MTPNREDRRLADRLARRRVPRTPEPRRGALEVALRVVMAGLHAVWHAVAVVWRYRPDWGGLVKRWLGTPARGVRAWAVFRLRYLIAVALIGLVANVGLPGTALAMGLTAPFLQRSNLAPFYDVRNFGVPVDGSTDAQPQLASTFTSNGVGLYVVPPGKTLGLKGAVVLPNDTFVAVAPGATVKWIGAGGGTMFTFATATPTVRAGVVGFFGWGVIDPNSAQAAGIVFDVHSLQVGGIERLQVLDGDATTIGLNLLADAAAAGGVFGTKNTTHSHFGKLVFGVCAKGVVTLGAPGRVTNCSLADVHVHDPRSVGFDFGTNTDTIELDGWIRSRPNVNNAIGVQFAGSAQCYGIDFQQLVVDTPAGPTGRQGVVFGNGCSRITIFKYWNNPVAEGGAIVDNGVASYEVHTGDWVQSGGGSSSLMRRQRNVYPSNRVNALTYGAAIAVDAGLAGPEGIFTINATNGTAFTISNPTALSIGQVLTFDIKNSSGGALGAITWGATYLLAGAFTAPANGKRRTISFYYDGTNLVETNRAAADI